MKGNHFRALQNNMLVSASAAAIIFGAPVEAAEPVPQEVAAQPTATTSEDGGISEIIVTANRRTESLSKAPLAISVLSQDQLTSQGITSTKDLTQSIPNLQIAVNGAGDSVVANIRGIQSSNAFSIGDPAVALYVNGINIPAPTGLNGGLYDLERVEVLRGPQGTLYGKNATAGSINIITAKPTHDLGGSFDASYSNFNEFAGHATLNLPVSETLAVRAAFAGRSNDGYFDTNGTTPVNYGRARELAGRFTALWTPNDVFKWQVTVSDYISHGTSNPGILTNALGKPVNGLPVYDQRASSNPTPYGRINSFGIQSRIDMQLSDAFSLAYLVGYGSVKQISRQVNMGVALPCTFGVSFCDIGLLDDLNKNYSQEMDLSYEGGRIKNIIGATYMYQTNRNRADFTVYNFGVNFNFTIPDYLTESFGFFDQATYGISDNVRLTGGLRYSHDRKRARGSFIQVCAPFTSNVKSYTPDPTCFLTAPNDTRDTFSAVNYKVVLDADLSPATVAFASVSSGYKAGGLNDASPFAPGVLPAGYDPEKVTNFEAGLKARLLDNRLQLNIDAFYMNYSNLQVTQVQQPVGYLTVNAASAKIYGLEVEATFKPTADTLITGFVNGLHAGYRKFNNAADQYSGIIYPSLSGNKLPNAPSFSARIRAQQDFHFAGGTISPSVAVYYQSKSYVREFNLPIDRVPAFTKTMLSLRYQDEAKLWSVEGYVDNLEDKAVRSAQFVLAGAYLSYYNPPRTYGLRVGRKF